jgi:magnesium transporter
VTSGPAGRRSLSEPSAGDRSPGASGGVAALNVVRWSPAGVEVSEDPALIEVAIADPASRVWVDVVDPQEALVARIGASLGLHPLVAEDIVERNQRAKIEFTDETLHLVMFAMLYDGTAELSEMDFVLGERFLLSVHEPGWQPERVKGLRLGAGAALAQGPDELLWILADAVVDDYFPILDRLDDELDRIQDDVVDRADRTTLQHLFNVKRELIMLRRSIAPTRETIGQLSNRQIALIRPERVVYFRDLYDHLIRATEDLDTLRELAAGTLDVYLSQVNNNLSLIMKRLTGVTVILAGIGAIAGIFGMSEAGAALNGAEATGFWLVAAFTVGIAVLGAAILHRLDWI